MIHSPGATVEANWRIRLTNSSRVRASRNWTPDKRIPPVRKWTWLSIIPGTINRPAASQDRSAGLSIFANCAPANAPKCADAAREEIARLLKEGVTAKELDDAKNSVAQQMRVTLSSDDAVTGMLVRQMVVGRTMKFIEDRSAEIQSLTVEQVNAALRKYVSPDKQVLIKAGDFGKN